MREAAARLTALLALLLAAPAAAGPPYATDDPQPTDLHHWEIYSFASGTGTRGRFDGTGGLDLNYGGLPGVQLTATLPVELAREGGRTRTGFGDVELGVKYRFFAREAAGVSLAIFPRVYLPTARRGFGSGRAGLLLPLWGQKDWGPWSLFGGGGFTLNPGDGNRNYWQGGIALTRTLSRRVAVGAEIVHNGADTIDARSYTAANLGATVRLGGPFSLIASGGPGLVKTRGGGAYNFYLALATVF